MEEKRRKDRDVPGALVMKSRYILILYIVIGGVLVWVASLLSPQLLRSTQDISCEGLKDVLGKQLEDSYVHARGCGEVYCARDEQEALRMFESGILPTLDDRTESRVSRLKSRISEGKSWTYELVSGQWRMCYLMDIFPSLTCDGYGFPYLISRRNDTTATYDPPCENHGLLRLFPREEDPREVMQLSTYEKFCLRLPRLRDGLPKMGEPFRGVEDGQMDVSAIVDVADVELVCVSGFDYLNRHQDASSYSPTDSGCAIYRVRLDVREVLSGQLASDVLILETRRMWHEFKQNRQWIYYRGMMLRIGLQKKNGEIYLVDELPVEPYPPYSNKGVRINGGSLVGGGLAKEFEWRLTPLVVEYGSHTKVEFSHGDIVTIGKRSSFVDFGVSSKFKIIELNEGANKAYWEKCWFASCLIGDDD